MPISQVIQEELAEVLAAAYRVSEDAGQEVQEVFEQGKSHPLTFDEAAKLLANAVIVLRDGAERRGDRVALASLEGDIGSVIRRLTTNHRREAEQNHSHNDSMEEDAPVELIAHNGIAPQELRPTPWYHGRQIPMNCGFVRTADIRLWERNERLDIHLRQFRQRAGRKPRPEELLDIMLSKMPLPGVSGDDQFKIVELARSVAVSGVRLPPILSPDGTLLDGNRRVASCYYILNSDEFGPDAKKRVEYIFAWQLTKHATDEDEKAVVVSLNFEDDYKEKWPEYVKARKIYDLWMDMRTRELRITRQRDLDLRKRLSEMFALGPDPSVVNRYIKMVEWANRFEEYHISKKGRDEYEVKHHANKYFQYFDELSKGASPGGVAYTLEQDDSFRGLVFDLLYDGKFVNWKQIRALKYAANSPEARDLLLRAGHEQNLDEAEDLVDDAVSLAQTKRAEAKLVGANQRIETFAKWLLDLPLSAFSDRAFISRDSLLLLTRACKLVDRQATAALAEMERTA